MQMRDLPVVASLSWRNSGDVAFGERTAVIRVVDPATNVRIIEVELDPAALAIFLSGAVTGDTAPARIALPDQLAKVAVQERKFLVRNGTVPDGAFILAFCETAAASSTSPWHIRAYEPSGTDPASAGLAGQFTLCGRDLANGWDLGGDVTSASIADGITCPRCARIALDHLVTV